MNEILNIGIAARNAAKVIGLLDANTKNKALHQMADAIRRSEQSIIDANKKDLDLANQKNMPPSFLDRLKLNSARINAMANGLETIADLPDPIGTILAEIKRPNGLIIHRVRVPLGVIGVIYESRPNVTADAAGLCFKSGNAVILRGGSESFHSSKAILNALHAGLKSTNFPLTSIQMIPTTDRVAVSELLKMDKYIDVIIPRGGQKLIETIASESRIPLFKHLAGLCHTYIHESADLSMAKKILVNAKMRRTGICGATEVLLIDQTVVDSHLPALMEELLKLNCEIRGNEDIIKIDSHVKLANQTDFDTEFLDAIIAVKIVKNVDAAIQHIAEHGTQHTDAIIAEDQKAAEQFLREVDSAIVMHNASTQFADGGEFGMGAEIGIATGKLHARGPVGVEQLTTFKYQVYGKGQVRPLK